MPLMDCPGVFFTRKEEDDLILEVADFVRFLEKIAFR